MDPARPARESDSPAAWGRSELLEQFEQAWRCGQVPRIEEFLPANRSKPDRLDFLKELIKIELEYRWRNRPRDSGNEPAHIETYVERFAELGLLDNFPLDLIGEEYRTRQLWGDRPGHAEFLRRFARQGPGLRQLLARIDADLATEFGPKPQTVPSHQAIRDPVVPGESAGPAAGETGDVPLLEIPESNPIRSLAEMVAALRQLKLFRPSQLDDLPQQSAKDARGLAQQLIQRGWLTAYQANQLLQGRGNELNLGPYVVLERLGEGGTGQVFKARHRQMNRMVAVKLIRRELLADADVVARFYREVQVISQLSHPNVVHAFDAGPLGDTHALILEYIEGIDLGKLVKQSGPLPVKHACDYIRQAALGLQHAHQRGLVHRDVKPSNLLLTKTQASEAVEVIKLLDLGLARLRRTENTQPTIVGVEGHTSSALTPVGAVMMMGTPDYLAPEQALDFHGADIRADIYGLGCTFYYLLTGQPPFPGGTVAQKLLRHQQADPPLIEAKRSDVAAPVISMLRRMLAKRPEDRYQTPAEVAAALAKDDPLCQPLARTKKWTIPKADGDAKPQAPLGRRWLAAAIGGALLLLFAIVVNLIGSRTPSGKVGRRTEKPARATGTSRPAIVSGKFRLLSKLGRPARCVAISPDGGIIAVGGDFSTRLFDMPAGTERQAKPQNYARSLAFTPDGKTLVCTTDSPGKSSMVLYPIPKADELERATFPGYIYETFAVSPDGRSLVVGGVNGEIYVLEIATRTVRQTIKGPQEAGPGKSWLAAVVFGRDNRTFAAAGNGSSLIHLWDTASGNERLTYQGHKDQVLCLTLSPDGKTLASGSQDATVRLWDWATGEQKLSLQGHAGPVRAVAFAPDGTLATAGDDFTIKLWSLTGQPLGELKGHTGPITALAWARTGRSLVSSSEDKTVLIWDVSGQP